jgi:hypothetical protein
MKVLQIDVCPMAGNNFNYSGQLFTQTPIITKNDPLCKPEYATRRYDSSAITFIFADFWQQRENQKQQLRVEVE